MGEGCELVDVTNLSAHKNKANNKIYETAEKE